MKISKLFHWLYALLMFLPFMAVAFNFVRFSMSGSLSLLSFNDVFGLISLPAYASGVYDTIFNVYLYLVYNVFGLYGGFTDTICGLLTYWTVISVVYLVFDVIMYVPLLVHRWLDKARLE